MTTEYRSIHYQIQQALCLAVRELCLTNLPNDDVQVRENFWKGESIFRGCSIHELGEEYDDGVIGAEDVGYRTALTFVTKKNEGAILTVEHRKQWVEACRRRFKNMRIPVPEFDLEVVKQHVLRVRHTFPAIPKQFRNEYMAEQLLITAWARELPDDGSE